MIKLKRNLFEGDGILTQGFGEHPEWYAGFGLKGHNGIDYGIPTGTQLYSCINGKVIEKLNDTTGYGMYVKIENDECGVLYGHMKRWDVEVGQDVIAGQQIGLSDNTGNSTGPHLHFGVFPKPRDRTNGYAGYINPFDKTQIQWVDTLEVPAMVDGIDISSYQGDIDFTKLNFEFVIMKATEGVGFTDSRLKANQSKCRDANIVAGYYHFARPDLNNKPEAEAEYFLSTVGTIKVGELLFLDFEVSYSDCVGWCRKWLDYVYNKTNCKPLIYLNQSQIKTFDWQPIIDAGYGLWAAIYDKDPTNFNYSLKWPVIAFKQYTNALSVSGISGNVDGDSFNGDINALKSYGYSGIVSNDNVSGELADCVVECHNLEANLIEMTEDRDRWKKSWSDLEEIYVREGGLKDEIIKENDKKIKELNEKVATLQEAISHNKTPLSEYLTKELISEIMTRLVNIIGRKR